MKKYLLIAVAAIFALGGCTATYIADDELDSVDDLRLDKYEAFYNEFPGPAEEVPQLYKQIWDVFWDYLLEKDDARKAYEFYSYVTDNAEISIAEVLLSVLDTPDWQYRFLDEVIWPLRKGAEERIETAYNKHFSDLGTLLLRISALEFEDSKFRETYAETKAWVAMDRAVLNVRGKGDIINSLNSVNDYGDAVFSIYGSCSYMDGCEALLNSEVYYYSGDYTEAVRCLKSFLKNPPSAGSLPNSLSPQEKKDIQKRVKDMLSLLKKKVKDEGGHIGRVVVKSGPRPPLDTDSIRECIAYLQDHESEMDDYYTWADMPRSGWENFRDLCLSGEYRQAYEAFERADAGFDIYIEIGNLDLWYKILDEIIWPMRMQYKDPVIGARMQIDDMEFIYRNIGMIIYQMKQGDFSESFPDCALPALENLAVRRARMGEDISEQLAADFSTVAALSYGFEEVGCLAGCDLLAICKNILGKKDEAISMYKWYLERITTREGVDPDTPQEVLDDIRDYVNSRLSDLK